MCAPRARRLMLVVTEDWYFASHRLPLARKALAAGWEVTVVTRCADTCEEIGSLGIRVIPFEMDRRGMNPLKELRTMFRLARLLRAEGPDLLHTVALKPVLLGGLAARLAGVRRRVSAVAGMGFLFSGDGRGGRLMPLVRRLLGVALRGGLVIVQNPDDAGLLRDMGVRDEDIRIIPGVGVDLDHFRPVPEPAGLPVVMLPSRLLWDKGVGEFVAAARSLLAKGVEARFVLVGMPDPDNPAAVAEEEIKAWVDEGVVEWWGHREDMPEVLAMAHVVCLPSYREGLPKVLLEAMACARPVVSCEVPGCREVVEPGRSGVLVPARNAAALASAIEQLVCDAALRRRLGEEGRRRVESRFSEEQASDATLAVYRELLQTNGG